jgi:hypothetical protein
MRVEIGGFSLQHGKEIGGCDGCPCIIYLDIVVNVGTVQRVVNPAWEGVSLKGSYVVCLHGDDPTVGYIPIIVKHLVHAQKRRLQR